MYIFYVLQYLYMQRSSIMIPVKSKQFLIVITIQIWLNSTRFGKDLSVKKEISFSWFLFFVAFIIN